MGLRLQGRLSEYEPSSVPGVRVVAAAGTVVHGICEEDCPLP